MSPVDPTPLSLVLNEARSSNGSKRRTLKDLTVLAEQNDPFRLDTPAKPARPMTTASHCPSRWLAGATIHLRGLHYVAVSLEAIKPNGLPYTNTEADWVWLSEHAAKAARWLGYVGFDQIHDNRNAAPIVRLHRPETAEPFLNVGIDVEIPDVEDLEPAIGIEGFVGVQPYRLVLIGEKSSLDPVLAPIAEAHGADLYLPTGEISDTLIFKIAGDTDIDGRPLVVLYFSDCDPGGWQMPISVGRKLQAFQAGWFPDIDFEVHRVALTPDQVRTYGLPSTPLKATELRASSWQAAMGVEQTEIDALAALQPGLLRQIALDAIAPFYDDTLEERVEEARDAWAAEAQAIVDAGLNQDVLARIRADAAQRLEQMSEQIDAINAALGIGVEDFNLPEPVIPDPIIIEEAHPLPLISSEWDWVEQTRRLVESKAYEAEGGQ